MLPRSSLFANAFLWMMFSGASVAASVTDKDIQSVPFIKDGRLAFSVQNKNKEVSISVGDFVPARAGEAQCPIAFTRTGGTVAPLSAITIETTVQIDQVLECVEPGWRSRFSRTDVIKMSDNPNAFPALQANGSATQQASPFAYTYTSTFLDAGSRSTLTSGFVYFQKID